MIGGISSMYHNNGYYRFSAVAHKSIQPGRQADKGVCPEDDQIIVLAAYLHTTDMYK